MSLFWSPTISKSSLLVDMSTLTPERAQLWFLRHDLCTCFGGICGSSPQQFRALSNPQIHRNIVTFLQLRGWLLTRHGIASWPCLDLGHLQPESTMLYATAHYASSAHVLCRPRNSLTHLSTYPRAPQKHHGLVTNVPLLSAGAKSFPHIVNDVILFCFPLLCSLSALPLCIVLLHCSPLCHLSAPLLGAVLLLRTSALVFLLRR